MAKKKPVPFTPIPGIPVAKNVGTPWLPPEWAQLPLFPKPTPKKVTCPLCNGTGENPPRLRVAGPPLCQECKGMKVVDEDL